MMWRQRALAANIPEITKVIEMFDRHHKGIINALCMGRNNGKAEMTVCYALGCFQDKRKEYGWCCTVETLQCVNLTGF
jgi:hypothetical protein